MSEAEPVTIESMQSIFDAILSLLARQVFPPQTLKQRVTRQKRRPNDYLRAYNLCDGERGVNQIDKEIGVSAGTLSPILAAWKEFGIVYEISRKGADGIQVACGAGSRSHAGLPARPSQDEPR